MTDRFERLRPAPGAKEVEWNFDQDYQPTDKDVADFNARQATANLGSDETLNVLRQRLREYRHNPHHINPMSERFQGLLDEIDEHLLNCRTLSYQDKEKQK